MPGIDDALERLITDTGFRAALTQDPRAALADYDLTEDERELLTSQLSQEAGASGGVEQRTSKSGLAGALGMFDDAVAAAPRDAGLDSVETQLPNTGTPQVGGYQDVIDVESWSWGETQSGWVYDEDSSCWIRVSQLDVPADQPDPAMTAPEDTSAAGKLFVGGLSSTTDVDSGADPDQPLVSGSVYNPEGDAASPGGTNEIRFEDKPGTADIPQENMTLNLSKMEHGTEDLEAMTTEGDPPEQLPGDLADREPSEEPDMGSPYLKMAAFSDTFSDTMDPPGDPDALVADGTDERPSSPTIVQPLVNNEVVEHDEPDVVMTDQDADTKEAPVKTGYDIKANKRV